MTLRALIGPNQFDAIAYVRGRMGDTGPIYKVSDATLASYLPAVAAEFSKWKPLGEFQIGNAYPPYSSPLTTVAQQERYTITDAFLATLNPPKPPIAVLEEVTYLATAPMSNAGGEVPYNMLTPPQLGGAFDINPSFPSSRIIRDYFNAEVDTYGVGFSQWGREIDGSIFIDLMPIPVDTGLPIFIRYTAAHPTTQSGSDWLWPTVADRQVKNWADLLWVNLLEDKVALFSSRGMVQAGLIRQDNDAGNARHFAAEMRERVELALGAATPVIERT